MNFDQITLKAIADWIERWEAIDYSWEGLAEKTYKIGGGRDGAKISCQVFWEGCELHEGPNGKKYTLFHLPAFYVKDDGGVLELVKTKKFDVLQKELEDGFRAWFGKWREEGPDHPIKAFAPPEGIRRRAFVQYDTSGIWTPKKLNLRGENGEDLELNDQCFFTDNDGPIISEAHNCLFMAAATIRAKTNVSIKFCTFAGGLYSSVVSQEDGANVKISLVNCDIAWLNITNWDIASLKVGSRLIFGFKSTFDKCRIKRLDVEELGMSVVPALRDLGEGTMITLPDSIMSGAFNIECKEQLALVAQRAAFEAGGDVGKQETLSRKYLTRIERGLSFLRTVHATKSNDYLVSRYHNYELWTREYNTVYPRWDRWLSLAYHTTSNYGNSTIRPIGALLVLLLVSSLIYTFIYTSSLGWTLRLSLDWLKFWADGLSFAIGRMVPFVTWDAKTTYPDGSFEKAMRTLAEIPGLAIHAMAAFQTTLSTVFLFLIGLACKRRFKVSDK